MLSAFRGVERAESKKIDAERRIPVSIHFRGACRVREWKAYIKN